MSNGDQLEGEHGRTDSFPIWLQKRWALPFETQQSSSQHGKDNNKTANCQMYSEGSSFAIGHHNKINGCTLNDKVKLLMRLNSNSSLIWYSQTTLNKQPRKIEDNLQHRTMVLVRRRNRTFQSFKFVGMIWMIDFFFKFDYALGEWYNMLKNPRLCHSHFIFNIFLCEMRANTRNWSIFVHNKCF